MQGAIQIKGKKKKDNVLRFFKFSILWGAFCSVLIFLAIFVGVKTSGIFAIKDGVIYLLSGLFLSTIVKERGSNFNIFLIICFTLLIVLNYGILNPNYKAPLANVRQIIGPLIVLLIYCQIKLERAAAFSALRYLCWIVITVFSLGVIEQVFGIWSKLNLTTFFDLKGIPTDSSGLSYMFYEPLFGNRIRMTSTFIDPISLGHFFASAGTLLFYTKNKKKVTKIAFYCCVVGLMLALSKGAILQFFIAIVLLNKNVNFLFRLIMATIPLMVLFFLESAGIAMHVNAFVNAVKTITIFGYGIGNAGNYAYMFGKSAISQELKIGDTYVGALLGQIGLVGTILWMYVGSSVVLLSTGVKKHTEIGIIMFISIVTVSTVSENTMNITSFLLPAIMIGLSIQLSKFSEPVASPQNVDPRTNVEPALLTR